MTSILLLLFLALVGTDVVAQQARLALEPFVSGVQRPVALANAGDGSGRLFVVEQEGRIRIIDNGIRAAPFLDIRDLVSCCGERGLLGLAFHPAYAANGRFFVNYTDRDGNTVVAEYRVSGNDPNVAERTSARTLLRVDQPFANHNGGHLVFGPDAYLYIGLGDGGSGGDPGNRAQDLRTLLGKILRIDVDRGDPYAIPPDNPFVSRGDARGEIWAYGLRNPWRFHFDRDSGDLWIADVGQNAWEEVNRQPASSNGGENYGWRRMEGMHCFNPSSNCNDGSLVLPVFEYGRDKGCSVTGGFVYRGVKYGALRSLYLFGDFCSGRLWAIPSSGEGAAAIEIDTGASISAFGEDESGELYVADYAGMIHRVIGSTAHRVRPIRRR